MIAAFLANPGAGGAGKLSAIGERLAQAAAGHRVYAVSGWGREALPNALPLSSPRGNGFLTDLFAAVDALAAVNPDLYILAGGDGLSAYVVDRLVTAHHIRPRVLGVAMGTANVGPVVTADALTQDLSLDNLTYTPSGAVEVLQNAAHVCYAFNDVVVGNTLLATVDGSTATVSARAMARDGSKVPAPAMKDISAPGGIAVTKNNRPAALSTPHPAQIILAPLEHDNLYGRAVAGLLCYNGDPRHRAAMVLCPFPIVAFNDDPGLFARFHAFDQLLFGPGDQIGLAGLHDDAQIISDGNPYHRTTKTLTFRYIPDVVAIARANS